MKDVNKRLCELLGCDVPRPKDICPKQQHDTALCEKVCPGDDKDTGI
jgi:hypothetical protein